MKCSILIKKKVVPANIADYLTPRALAYWISEDGAYTGAGILLHTNCFTREEVELLISLLESGIKSNIRAKYDNWIIIFPAKEMSRLRELVTPYIHQSMKHQIGLN